MPSNNSKYTEEFREQTVKHIFETGKSATRTAEEMGIDTNTVCRWVRDYRRKYNMPTYAEEKGIRSKPPKDSIELRQRIKELEAKLKEKNIQGSMSKPGCPYDNSCVESFFASIKKEKIYRRKYDTIEEVKKDVFWYIEMFYNRRRRHSSSQYMTPVEYLRRYEEIKVA